MSVLNIERYRQLNGEDILKVILKQHRDFQKVIFIAIVVMKNWLDNTLGGCILESSHML